MFCHDFATTRLALVRFIERIRDFSSRDVSFYAAKNDYALYAAVGPRIDTVGVWGSNPHAPTIFIELFRYFCPPFVVHGTVWQTFGRLSKI